MSPAAAVRSHPWLLAGLAFLPVAVLRAATLAESDTFWQIRTGLLTIDSRRLPAVDPFSWTVPGRPWTLNSWGFNVLIAAVYRGAGLAGVAVACGLLVMATAGLVLVAARRLGASPLVAATLLLLGAVVLIPYLSARPQLVDYVGVLALVLLLRRLLDRPSIGCLIALGAVTVAWVNLHAGALLGVAIVGVTGMLAWPRRDRRRWCLSALVVVTLGALANPYGVDLIAQTTQVKGASQGVVIEWQHLDPTNPVHVITVGLGLAALGLAVRRREVVYVAALVVAVAGAVAAERMLPVLLLAALPVLAAGASSEAVLGRLHRRRVVLGPPVALLMALLCWAAGVAVGHLGQPDPARYPAAVVQAIPAGCRVYNSYLVGGYVEFARPDVAVSLDSRNDLYGAPAVLAAKRVLAGEGDVARALAGAGCALVPDGSGLANHLAGSAQWVRTAAGGELVLYVRR